MTGLRILIVEDEPELLAVLSDYLRGAGHEVVAVRSGHEAIAAVEAATAPFAAAVVDWSMAGISGRDVIEHLHVRAPDTRLFVATAHGDHEVSPRHCEAPLEAILRKPFSLRALARAIGSSAGRAGERS